MLLTQPFSAAAKLGSALGALLEMGASANLYMWHGGTNFGLTSGAQQKVFKINPTSYDYDAPQSEWGNSTCAAATDFMNLSLFLKTLLIWVIFFQCWDNFSFVIM